MAGAGLVAESVAADNLEVFDAVREAFPAVKPVSIRVSATDWVEGGVDIEQTCVFAKALDNERAFEAKLEAWLATRRR